MATRTVMESLPASPDVSCGWPATYQTWPIYILPNFSERCTGDRFGGNPEMSCTVPCTARSRRTEFMPMKMPIGTDDGVPALPHRGFDADFDPRVADDGAAGIFALLKEQLEAGHRDHARRRRRCRASSFAPSTAIATSEPVAKIDTSERPSGPAIS